MLRISILAFILAAHLSACKDTPEKIPSYIRIEPFVVNAQGNASWHKITDGWLYVNGEYLGAYTLPAEVPVIAEGPCDIIVFPGVKENGIATSPNIYPNLTRWDGNDVTLPPAQTTVVQPSASYDQRTIFPFGAGRGDFDGGSNIVIENRDEDPDNGFSITADSAFFGKCILVQVDTAHPLLDIAMRLEEVALHDEYFISRKLYPNVDFYSGLIMRALGIPLNMFTVMFAIGRMPGWIAQWREVAANPKLKIYRPRQIYVGSPQRNFTPINLR